MPLTFPTSPTNGQTVTLSGTTYTYNATKGVWEATASGGGFVAGSFSEHILPDANDTYDIGSASNKIRDIYVSDNSLHIGDHTMSADSEGINIPALKLGTGSNRVKLTANAEGKLRQIRTVGGVAQAEEGISSDAGTTAVDTMAELQASPVVAGKTVLVRNTNKLYINTGTGWYVVGQVTNESPTAITGLDATYSLASDGTATVITMNSTDPEGFPLTWSHAVTTGTLGSTATITNVDNVFTITPSSTEADAGSFSVTFSASDGNQAATSVSAFTLAWYTFVKPTVYTSAGNGSTIGASIASQTATSITFDMDTYDTSFVKGRGDMAGLELPYGKYYFEAVTTNNINHDMFTLTKYNFASQPITSPGAFVRNYGWIYNTSDSVYTYYHTNDIGLTSPSGAAYAAFWSLSSHANAESRMGIAYDSATNNWWMRLGRSAWMWGDPVAGTGGYTGSTAGVSNGTSHKFFLGTGSSTGNYSFRVESQPLHQYSTPTGFTPL